ncbi:MAG TPA: hypothetical protein VHQ65_07440 [Thermoanaerobaculia bacterium]|nr:hypothetical protein [Thermoanaerobaculia bacterium]
MKAVAFGLTVSSSLGTGHDRGRSTLVDADLAAGGTARGGAGGEASVDAGTLRGYRHAQQLLIDRAPRPEPAPLAESAPPRESAPGAAAVVLSKGG